MNPKLDRRIRRTRRRLREAMIELIVEKGYDPITIQDITDKADLSRATFYLHYKDKDELLASSLEEMFDELIASMDGPLFSRDWVNLPIPPSVFAFRHVAEYHALYKALLLGERGVTYVINRALQYLARIAERQILALHPDTNHLTMPIEIISHTIAGALYAVILWWLEHDMPHTPEYMGRAFQYLIVPGILNTTAKPITWDAAQLLPFELPPLPAD